jgi:hypothetical protein
MAAIEAQLANLGKPATGPKKTYAQASDDVTRQTKELVNGIARMAETAKNSPEKIGDATKHVAEVIPQLILATNAAVASSSEEEVRKKLQASAKNVVLATRDAVAAAKNVAADPKSATSAMQMSQQQRTTTQAIGGLLNAVKEGATLERDADYAVARIQATMAELDNASLFAAATAGQLEVDLAQGSTLDTCQQSLSKEAKQVLAQIDAISKCTVPAGSQDALGKAFRQFADSVERSGKGTKDVASLMHDLVAQQDVLTAAKAAAISSHALVLSSKEAMVRPDDADAKKNLREKLTSASTAVNDLIRVSESASAAAVKGIRELEKAEKDIQQQLGQFANPGWAGNRNAGAEDVVKAARIIAGSSGNIVSTCTNDNEGLVLAAQQSSKGICQLLADAKGAAQLSDDPKVQSDLNAAVKNTATTTLALLAAAKTAKDTPQSQKNMSTLSEQVADRILEVVGAARRLPGGAGLRLEEDSGDDLESLAEKELMKAAKMIEEAAKTYVPSHSLFLLSATNPVVQSAGSSSQEGEDLGQAGRAGHHCRHSRRRSRDHRGHRCAGQGRHHRPAREDCQVEGSRQEALLPQGSRLGQRSHLRCSGCRWHHDGPRGLGQRLRQEGAGLRRGDADCLGQAGRCGHRSSHGRLACQVGPDVWFSPEAR